MPETYNPVDDGGPCKELVGCGGASSSSAPVKYLSRREKTNREVVVVRAACRDLPG